MTLDRNSQTVIDKGGDINKRKETPGTRRWLALVKALFRFKLIHESSDNQ